MKKLNRLFIAFIATAFVASVLLVTGCSSSGVQNKSNGKKLVMDSAYKQGKLDNGMSYLIRENGEPKNRIQLRLVVKTGSCMEDDDQKGLAHFIEHLCFNGTEHFEKSAIIDYFETIGMQFGPEINAETTFENTVYMLELPADNPEMLKTSLLVLHDWACAVTFDPVEIEKERGVIVEEWRARTQQVNGRLSDKILKNLFKDSRYGERITLGDMDVIRNISRERIMDYYHKWYRPENMTVVAVGDIKTGTLEKAIKEVMGTIPASENSEKLPFYNLPEKKEKELTVIRDKELNYIKTEIYKVIPEYEAVKTVEQYRKDFAIGYALDTFNLRCQEITNKADSPWIQAGLFYAKITNHGIFGVAQFFPKNGMFNEAFKTYLDEYERFMNFGPTESEMQLLKQAYTQNIWANYDNRKNLSSVVFAGEMVDYILKGGTLISRDDNLKLALDIVENITAEEVLETAREFFKDRGDTMFVMSPESFEIPSDKEIKDIWNNYVGENSKVAYNEEENIDSIMSRPAAKAKIIEKKAIKELGGTQYTFENGVKIITKKTDFQNNDIQIYAGSKGGFFQLKEKDIPSARMAVEYAAQSGLAGKTYSQIHKYSATKNLNVNYGISNTEEYLTASACKENIEETLQIMYQIFTAPQFTEEAWTTIVSQYSEVAATYGAKPIQTFVEKLNEFLYGKTLWKLPRNKEFMSKLDAATAERVFRERYGNAADFTFVFVGDFDEKNLVDLCAYYLGNILTNDSKDETKYVYFPFPKSNKTLTVKKGVDNYGYVYVGFGGELPQSDDIEQKTKESVIINQMNAVLDIRLREVIREDKSGSYGVGCYAGIDGWPDRYYYVGIEFGCEPARQEELSAAVVETINDIKAGNISDELLVKVKESYSRSIETALRNNGWWINRFAAEVLYTYEPLWFTSNSQKAVDWITKEAIIEAANKYLDTNRMVTAYLKPEK